MGWLRLDDQYDDHPKIVTAGPEAAWLDVRGMLFCARHETDGFIPEAQLTRIGSEFSTSKRRKLVSTLVSVQRWEKVDGGYRVNDFLEYNPTQAQKEDERAAARERMRKARENKGRSSGEQKPNKRRSSGNPVPAPPLSSPPTPPEGGRRANGTNPRSVAKNRELESLRLLMASCSECSDNPNVLCGRCTGLNRKISELVNA